MDADLFRFGTRRFSLGKRRASGFLETTQCTRRGHPVVRSLQAERPSFTHNASQTAASAKSCSNQVFNVSGEVGGRGEQEVRGESGIASGGKGSKGERDGGGESWVLEEKKLVREGYAW